MGHRLINSAIFGNSIARLHEAVYGFAIAFRAHSRNVAGMILARLFTQHPASVGETYLQHLRSAATFAIRMLAGGLACMVHAFLPFLFERTASHCIHQLHERVVVHRAALQQASRRAGLD
jgi:hypothetical protein